MFQERKRVILSKAIGSTHNQWTNDHQAGSVIFTGSIGYEPPKRRPNLPRSPVNSQPTNIGHRRQLFGLVDHSRCSGALSHSGSMAARKDWIKYLAIGVRTLKTVAAVDCPRHRRHLQPMHTRHTSELQPHKNGACWTGLLREVEKDRYLSATMAGFRFK